GGGLPGRLPDGVKRIVGIGLGELDDRFDRGAQVAMMLALEGGEIVQMMEVEAVVYQHRVVERLLVEIETFEARERGLEAAVIGLDPLEERSALLQDFIPA